MTITANDIVSDLAIRNRNAIPVFETIGIDYCCNGNRSLREACTTAGVSVDIVIEKLGGAPAGSSEVAGLVDERLSTICKLVCEQYHRVTREELHRLELLVNKVADRHGPNHPELANLREAFYRLPADMHPHMMKEEQILFPYVVQMENETLAGRPVPPPFFGTVRNPIQMMMSEHDVVGDTLREIRSLSANFELPADACISYQALYEGLRSFESLTHEHIHVENNILFKRAIAMETAGSPESAAV